MAISTDDATRPDHYPRRIPASRLSVCEFIEEHLVKNEPLIITGCTDDWMARKRWLNEDGSPNLAFLVERFGDCTVPIVHCQTKRSETTRFSDFMDELVKNPQTDSYLRDWHFMSDPASRDVWYRVPAVFQNDWVNRDALGRPEIFGGDYRFCYMGGSGTFTSFHSDVFNSYSWSANICGKKLWYMMPEGAENRLSDDCDDIVDIRSDPRFFDAGGFTFQQMPGEMVFVPSGWFHQVHNQGFTISINHNWLNSFNLRRVLDLMFVRLEAVKHEIRLMRDELQDHVKYVEDFLRLDYGLNMERATLLCKLIMERRPAKESAHDLSEKCSCESLYTVCTTCQSSMNLKDFSIAKEFLVALEEKQLSIDGLEWLKE